MQFIGIIPARYASSRFPGKPLAMIGGKTMIQRVYEQAKQVLDLAVVATDDHRIYDTVKGFGGMVVMTSTSHLCGTSRCEEALEIIKKTILADSDNNNIIIINIQGDEPFVQPEQIASLMACFEDKQTEIATLVKPFTNEDGLEALKNPNTPKVVIAKERNIHCQENSPTKKSILGNAIYFSRSVIPYLRGVREEQWLNESIQRQQPFYKHIGLYAYRSDILHAINQLPISALEQAESLEQLRWLEAGYTIKVASTNIQTIGIDTPEDLAKVETFLINQANTKIAN